jgi:SAM-dependent methyltransferase
MVDEPPRLWASGDVYEPYVGRWSRLVAREFVDWLAVPAGGDWLDVGCGTGALTSTVLARCAPASVLGVEPSEGFLAHARAHVTDSRVRFEQGDAQRLPVPDRVVDAVVSGLVLNFVPDTGRAIDEMRRVTRRGGVVALYVWDYAGRMELMRSFWDAAAALDPAAVKEDEGQRFTVCQPEPLRALFEAAGLRDVETRAIDIPTVFRDFDDYWTPFLGGQAPAPRYCMSLTDDGRTRLQAYLHSTLPIQADGTIHLIARAWAIRGRAG